MPKRKRRTQQFKLPFVGSLSLSNFLDWIIVFALVGVILFVTKNLGGVRPETMQVGVLLFGLVLVLHGLWFWLQSKQEGIVINTALLWFVPYGVYLLVHLLFISPVPWRAWPEVMNYWMGFGILWIAVHNLRSKSHVWAFLIGLIAVGGLSVLMAYNQYFRHPERLPMGFDLPAQYAGRATGPMGSPNSFAGLMLLVIFPIWVCAFSKRLSLVLRVFCGYVGLMFFLGLVLSMSRGGLIAGILGVILLPFFIRSKNKSKVFMYFLVTAAAFGLLFTLLLSSSLFQTRFVQLVEQGGESSRKVLWESSVRLFLDNPIFGHGIGAFGAMFENYRPAGFNNDPVYVHNDYLQTLSDTGIVGFVLLFIPILVLLVRALKAWAELPDLVRLEAPRRMKLMPTQKLFLGALILGLGMFLVHLVIEFHLKIPALLFFVFAYVGILFKCIPQDEGVEPQRSSRKGLAGFIVCLFVAVAIPVLTSSRYEGASHLMKGKKDLADFADNFHEYRSDHEFIQEMVDRLQLAVDIDESNADSLSALSYAVYHTQHISPEDHEVIGIEAEGYARKAIDSFEGDKWYWIHLGSALWIQGRMDEVEEAFKRATQIAPESSKPWYYYASVLAVDPKRKDDALAAIDKSLSLNGGNASARRLRTRILIP